MLRWQTELFRHIKGRCKRLKAKEYLLQLKKLDNQIKQKQTQVKELESMRGSLGSIDYSEERVQTSGGCSSQVEKGAVRLLMLENEVKEDIINYALLKDKIIKEIHQLSDANHISILFKRYVEFKSLEKIAVEMSYTYQYAREIHGIALQTFQRTYTNLQKNVV